VIQKDVLIAEAQAPEPRVRFRKLVEHANHLVRPDENRAGVQALFFLQSIL
jgi:hypothetical protein